MSVEKSREPRRKRFFVCLQNAYRRKRRIVLALRFLGHSSRRRRRQRPSTEQRVVELTDGVEVTASIVRSIFPGSLFRSVASWRRRGLGGADFLSDSFFVSESIPSCAACLPPGPVPVWRHFRPDIKSGGLTRRNTLQSNIPVRVRTRMR